MIPTPLVTLHGIEVDTTDMQLRMPLGKLVDASTKINARYRRKKASLRASLIGILNFVCRVVVPGRAFLRRLIDLTRWVRGKSHLVHLNPEARKDLAAWKLFLDNFNGVSNYTGYLPSQYLDIVELCSVVFGCQWIRVSCSFRESVGPRILLLWIRWFQGSFS